MMHKMNLNEKAFFNIKNGIKKFELRLNDEKRKSISLNDTIAFYNLNNSTDTVLTKVIALLNYSSFKELFFDIDFNLCGPANSLEEKLQRIYKFYSVEEEQKYGILAIKLEIIN